MATHKTADVSPDVGVATDNRGGRQPIGSLPDVHDVSIALRETAGTL